MKTLKHTSDIIIIIVIIVTIIIIIVVIIISAFYIMFCLLPLRSFFLLGVITNDQRLTEFSLRYILKLSSIFAQFATMQSFASL